MKEQTLTRTPAQVTLKARQQEAFNTIMNRLAAGAHKQLVNLPTGLGKTILATYTAGSFRNTLVTVPTLELLEQTENTIRRLYPSESVGRIHGQRHEVDARFVITTIATLNRRYQEIDPRHFDLVICDECHHARAATWERTLTHFNPRLLLGLSATPERLDGLALSAIFDEISYAMNTKEAVEENYLAMPIGIQVITSTNLDEVKTTAGDFNQADLSNTVNTFERNHLVVDAHQEHAAGRKTIAFTVTINHAKELATAFQERGIKADWVSGADPKREEKIAAYHRGEIELLTNVNVLTEGFDDPATECIIMARPTTSTVLYTQALGRGLRTHAGKNDCIIIDVADNTRKHRLVNIWDFWGTPQPQRVKGPINLLTFTRELQKRFRNLINPSASDEVISELVNLLEPAPELPEPKIHTASVRAPAHTNALRMLIQYGINVFEHDWTVWQANQALKYVRNTGRERNPLILKHLN